MVTLRQKIFDSLASSVGDHCVSVDFPDVVWFFVIRSGIDCYSGNIPGRGAPRRQIKTAAGAIGVSDVIANYIPSYLQ